jgi:hypothetical protein
MTSEVELSNKRTSQGTIMANPEQNRRVARGSKALASFMLAESLHQQLNMYALAAGAAGVSLLALAQPSEAKIIYRHTNVAIGGGGVSNYNLDLNHDGITDFAIKWESQGFLNNAWLGELPAASNAVVAASSCRSSQSCTLSASALYRGAKIGPGQVFHGGSGMMAERECVKDKCKDFGQWRGVTNRYLGLKFMIKGKIHYGWARLSVNPFDLAAKLTGYAYETIPNKPIIAGHTKGPVDESGEEDFGPGASLTSPIPERLRPASIGMLALGAQGVPLWRRKENESVLPGN